VLTSDSTAPAHILPKRVATAIEAGCGGLICAVEDVREARQLGPRLTIVTPGIRPAGSPTHDQARSATPQAAFDAGADLLVIGRAVTAAPDPVVAAAELIESITL
jgi:orotidine-5'-phosphate decarboxylase